MQRRRRPRSQRNRSMGSKTVVMGSTSSSTDVIDMPKPKVALGIQSDAGFTEAAKNLRGRDLCSMSDLSVQELAAIMELAHAVKAHPEDFKHALDGKQM